MSEKSVPEAFRFLTITEVAVCFGACRRTIEREVAAGNFPRPLRIGRLVRFDAADVRAFIEKRKAESTGPALK